MNRCTVKNHVTSGEQNRMMVFMMVLSAIYVPPIIIDAKDIGLIHWTRFQRRLIFGVLFAVLLKICQLLT